MASCAPMFFNKTFDETMNLLLEARSYIAYQEWRDAARLGPAERMRVSCETTRLTARLTQVMAWLLTQKAVVAGELSREQAAHAEWRLAGHEVCLGGGEREGGMPPGLRYLLTRSQNLFERVARLDQMAEASVTVH